MILQLNIRRGINSIKNVGKVKVLNLCTSCDGALYFYKVLHNISQRVSEFLSRHDLPF